MVNKGPISVVEIEDELEKKRGNLGGTVYKIYKKMGRETLGTEKCFIYRCKEKGQNESQKYYAVDNINAEDLYRKYTALGVKDSTNDRVKPKVPEKRLSDGLKLKFKDALGMDITVSGKIDVVFSWKG